MLRKKFPYPKRYWANIAAMCAASALLFVDIFVSDRPTGDKEFCDYGPTDWRGFALFMVSLVALVLLVFCFAARAGKYVRARKRWQKIEKTLACREKMGYNLCIRSVRRTCV